MTEIIISSAAIRTMLPKRNEHLDKTGFGRLLCICGCNNMPGAAVLACGSALRSGVGLVTVASSEPVCRAVNYAYPGAVLNILPHASDGSISSLCADTLTEESNLSRYTAVLFGCGIGINDGGRAILRALLSNCRIPLIIDADGLNLLSEDINLLEHLNCPVILTPHERELKRLLNGAKSDSAAQLAANYGITVVSKGACTEIFGKKSYIVNRPNSALAKGGSGDILAGLISGLAAQGADPADAATAGVYIHSEAGRLASQMHTARAVLVTDILDEIGVAFAETEQEL